MSQYEFVKMPIKETGCEERALAFSINIKKILYIGLEVPFRSRPK
jgi:hypothetical protein